MRRPPLLAAGLAVAAALLLPGSFAPPAGAAGTVTVSDASYLDDRFGIRKDDNFMALMSRREQAELHEAIQSRAGATQAFVRDVVVGNLLVRIYRRQCEDWARTNAGSPCPPARDKSVQPGKDIADRQCNSCHLFGTGDAPAFFSLARSGNVDEARIAGISHHDPRMVTLHPSPEQARDIAAYINSLK